MGVGRTPLLLLLIVGLLLVTTINAKKKRGGKKGKHGKAAKSQGHNQFLSFKVFPKVECIFIIIIAFKAQLIKSSKVLFSFIARINLYVYNKINFSTASIAIIITNVFHIFSPNSVKVEGVRCKFDS